MAAEPPTTSLQRFLIVLASLVLIVGSLYLAQKVLIPLILAVLLTFVLSPLVLALQRRGLKRVPAVLMVALLAFLFLAGIGWAVASQVQGLAGELPRHKDTISNKLTALWGSGEGTFGTLLHMVQEIVADLQRLAQPDAADQTPVVVQAEKPAFLGSITGMVGSLVEGLATTGLVVVLVIFMLLMREDLRNRVLRLIGRGRLTHTTKAIDDATQRISRFLFMQSVINVAFGILLGLGLALIGVPYALLWGFLAAVLRYIPYLGTWVAMTLPLIYSVAVFPGWLQPLAALGVFVALELLTANVLEPLLLGRSTGISPVALLTAAAFWTWLWGPIGLILSTPLTTCLVVLGKYVPQLEFLDILLGDERVLETKVRFYQRLLAHDQDEALDLVEDYLERHPLEELFENVLLPALIFARLDRDRGELSPDEEHFILQVIREILDDLPASEEDEEQDQPRLLIYGCPARDEGDELALHMLRMLLEPSGCRVQVLSARMLSAEVVARMRKEVPALVCLAALPPGGLAQARYLCKRLRAQAADLKIAVGRWHHQGEDEKAHHRLEAAGANYVATSLRESRDQVLSLLPVLASPEAETPRREPVKLRSSDGLVPS